MHDDLRTVEYRREREALAHVRLTFCVKINGKIDFVWCRLRLPFACRMPQTVPMCDSGFLLSKLLCASNVSQQEKLHGGR